MVNKMPPAPRIIRDRTCLATPHTIAIMPKTRPKTGMKEAPPMAYARHPTDFLTGGGVEDWSDVMALNSVLSHTRQQTSSSSFSKPQLSHFFMECLC